jgi:transposase
MKKRASKDKNRLQVHRPDAAGVDIGSRQHWVAVPEDRDAKPVQPFETVTSDLHRLADWLATCGVTTVAMESTGVYWLPLYEILEQRGFEVLLVNASHVKNVPGRKSDVRDCQWIQQLHSYGLLRGSFRPTSEIAELRTYMRQRQTLVESAARELQHMQRSLMLMNIQLHHVVSDISGKTGMLIVRALASGNYDPKELAVYRDPRCRASEARIVEALQGNYQPEHVFVLKQALDLYDAYQTRIAECDARIEQTLASVAARCPKPPSPPLPAKKRGIPHGNQPTFEIRDPLHRITAGADLTQIPGIANLTALNLLSEVGPDMTRWPTEKHFVAWLNLAPGTNITGGKVLTARRPAVNNRAGILLRQAAVSLGKTSTALGAFYRRLAARRGKGKALVATARKLACLVYRLLRHGGQYLEQGVAAYEEHYRMRKIAALRRQAKSLGLHLVELLPAT